MASIATMIIRISGLGSREISAYDFIRSIVEQTDGGKVTTRLSAKQVEIVERIHNKHFAG